METLLGSDIRFLLQNHLNLAEIYKLSQIYQKKKLVDIINNICILEMKTRLKDLLQDDYEDFMSVMEKNGAVISGSFIGQCMLKENWRTDIDIFVPMIGNKIGENDQKSKLL